MHALRRIVFAIAAITLILIACVWGYQNWRFQNSAERAIGTVIALKPSGSHPEVQYATAEQQTRTFTANGLIFGYAINDRVPVLYRLETSQQSIHSFGALFGFPTMLLGMALVFGTVAITQRQSAAST